MPNQKPSKKLNQKPSKKPHQQPTPRQHQKTQQEAFARSSTRNPNQKNQKPSQKPNKKPAQRRYPGHFRCGARALRVVTEQ